MLRYLVAHPGRLVTKAELRQHVWAGTHVTDTVLRVCVREIRAALGDAAAAPQYLETVGRQGYRFLVGGDLESPPRGRQVPSWGASAKSTPWRGGSSARPTAPASSSSSVGKRGWARRRWSICSWPAWPPGAGCGRRGGSASSTMGRANRTCPSWKRWGGWATGPSGTRSCAVLRRYAPMWLVQLPGLVSEPELERLQRQVHGATPARMLRELAEALDVLTADRPLVLVLEDLQWSDHSTVEVLASLAQRREPARLLVLGTYRPVEVVLQGHPLRGMVQELCGRGQAANCGWSSCPPRTWRRMWPGGWGGRWRPPSRRSSMQRTDGNALFMVNIVEHLVQQGLVVRRAGQWTLREEGEAQVASLPEGLRQLLLRRIEALPPAARRVLEVASVVGEAFAVAAVAAGAQGPVEDVEARVRRVGGAASLPRRHRA